MFNLGYQIFRADKSITKEKNSQTFSYMGHNVKNLNVWILGGGGGLVAAMTGCILLPSYKSSHLNQYTCKIWKQSNKDILCYLKNDEMSADAA